MAASSGLERIRNIGIVAHIDAGKTTVSERILYYTGRQHKMGSVDEGTATMDWMPEEQKRGITITAAATFCRWRDCSVNIIDTPGHVDFTAEVERSLRVLDGAIVVFCGVGGVQAQSESVWRQADRYAVPRIAFINKMDRIQADFDSVLDQIRRKLSAPAVAVQMPLGTGADHKGVIDLVNMKAVVFEEESLGAHFAVSEVPDDKIAEARSRREEMIDRITETSDAVMEEYLSQGSVRAETLIAGIRKATIEGRCVPVLCGAALRNKGIQPVLDAVCDYLPSPLDLPPVIGRHPKAGQRVERTPDPDGPLCALAFKVAADSHGFLTYIRVYSGTLEAGKGAFNPRADKTENVTNIWKLHANSRELIDSVRAGEIGAVVGLRYTVTGDTLCDRRHPIVLEHIQFPHPVISMAIEPKTLADKDKLLDSLQKLAKEDPTFQCKENEETGEMVISGMGELHLEVLKHRLLEDFGTQAKVGKPRVAYRETVAGAAEGHGRFVKQVGGRGHFAGVRVSVEPNGKQLEPVVEISADAAEIPKQFADSVREGVLSALASGPKAGLPMGHVRVRVTGGECSATDSTALAFAAAAAEAVRSAVERAGSEILEPIMLLEVSVPDAYFGDILADLAARRSNVLATEVQKDLRVIRVHVPLAEVFGYATTVRSLSQGRASYTMAPASYSVAPKNVGEAFA